MILPIQANLIIWYDLFMYYYYYYYYYYYNAKIRRKEIQIRSREVHLMYVKNHLCSIIYGHDCLNVIMICFYYQLITSPLPSTIWIQKYIIIFTFIFIVLLTYHRLLSFSISVINLIEFKLCKMWRSQYIKICVLITNNTY